MLFQHICSHNIQQSSQYIENAFINEYIKIMVITTALRRTVGFILYGIDECCVICFLNLSSRQHVNNEERAANQESGTRTKEVLYRTK